MFLILEGSDGAGKSTLARHLQRLIPGAATVHHGPYRGVDGRELAATYMGSMRPALEGRPLIMDRAWLSEPIYAEVYRQAPSRVSPSYRRMLERAALAAGAIIIRCQPPYGVCREAFMSGRDEMMDDEDQLRRVYAGYTALTTELPMVTYDWGVESADKLLRHVHDVYRTYDTDVRVQLVGDRPNVRTHAQSALTVPFVSFSGHGCSGWLAEELEAAGIPERSLRWVNAYDNEGRPHTTEDLISGVPIIALGQHASRWCCDNGLAHTLCPHPQAHRRFYAGKPYPLIEELKNALKL